MEELITLLGEVNEAIHDPHYQVGITFFLHEDLPDHAAAKRCDQAVLIYPVPLARPMDVQVGPIRVRSLGFPLGGDLDAAGRNLLAELGLGKGAGRG